MPLSRHQYKICDSLHGFIRFGQVEKRVIDSRPFQRLRYIRQLGVTYLIYPGGAHARFEHSLGVMELASRIYDTLVLRETGVVPRSAEEREYWRLILRLGALCHDMGHLPFSHTAEKSLLPGGGHERMTIALIQSEEMQAIWREIPAQGHNPLEDIMKVAVHEEELSLFSPITLTPWERVLSQIITEDNFGADRMDYLLRDARYTGVGYGYFDYHQLIDTLRILPDLSNPALFTIGITSSGIQSVESLWMARYLMYARVYHHPKARAYAMHLNRFMMEHYAQKGFPSNCEGYIRETDYVIQSAILLAAQNGNEDAQVLLKERHSYTEVPLTAPLEAWVLTHTHHLTSLLGPHFLDLFPPPKQKEPFPVEDDERIASSLDLSPFLANIPLHTKRLTLYVPDNQSLTSKRLIEGAI